MKKIENCTLICCDTYNYGAAVSSLKKTMAQCEFTEVLFFTNIPINIDGVRVIEISELKGKDGYSHFILKEAYKHITTDFVLVTQHDSWVLDGELFDERLYKTDYAGALWLENDGLANGNGGLSWRSHRLMKTVGEDDFINATSPEDVAICRVYRRYLEKNYNLVWASDEVCEQFSFELRTPMQPTFGFHNFFHKPYQKTVVIKRTGAMGDVVAIEPVMAYFHNKGYRIVLDTLPQFYLFFINHFYKVHKLQDVDGRLISTAKHINLDGSYEAEPQMNHLEAYFKYSGIEEPGEYLRKPQLSVGFSLDDGSRIFKKYAVIHNDIRPQGGRNIQGIRWTLIVGHLKSLGYVVIQLGKGEHEAISGAIEMNITNENFLSYVVGGANLFVGIDSGLSNIAVAFGVPSVIFFGAVDAKKIHYDLKNIEVIDMGSRCDTPKCWHLDIGNTEGRKCYVDEKKPPCVQFNNEDVIYAINKLL